MLRRVKVVCNGTLCAWAGSFWRFERYMDKHSKQNGLLPLKMRALTKQLCATIKIHTSILNLFYKIVKRRSSVTAFTSSFFGNYCSLERASREGNSVRVNCGSDAGCIRSEKVSDVGLFKMIKKEHRCRDREEGTGNVREKKNRGNRWGKRK